MGKGIVNICLGLQWGDEGKGKIVDFLVEEGEYDIIARFQGGSNAGHTLWIDKKKNVLHIMPSGIFHQHTKNFVGPGVVADPSIFLEEVTLSCQVLKCSASAIKRRVYVSELTFLTHPFHKWLDKAIDHSKGSERVDTTAQGIGPTYAAIKNRTAFRFADVIGTRFFTSRNYKSFLDRCEKELNFYKDAYGYTMPTEDEIKNSLEEFKRSIEKLKKYVTFVDCFWLEDQLKSGSRVLAEGAQGSMLDNNFGCYPKATSSNTIASAVPLGLGIPMNYIGETIGVFKWYTTKVGGGIFPSLISDPEIEQLLQEAGGEVGATTGRRRDCGWLDLVQLKHAIRLSYVTKLIMTKVDINPLDELQVIEKYRVKDKGVLKVTDKFPVNLKDIQEVIPGSLKRSWTFNTENPLAPGLGLYIAHIENATGVKITHISYGPNRDDILKLP